MLQTHAGEILELGGGQHAAWYAVHTRNRAEKVASGQLSQKGIQTFLPLIAETRRWSDRSKVISLPLFPNYVFVRIAMTGRERLQVLKTVGVQAFVGAGGTPQPIPDKEIDDVKRVFQERVECSPHPFCQVGDKVRIRGGCLDGVEGIFVGKNTDRSFSDGFRMAAK